MSEVRPYQSEQDLVFETGKSQYLEDDRVKTGKLLRVTHLAGAFENIASTEYVVLGYWNGHAYVPLKKDKPPEASDFVHWDGEIWLFEGQYAYAYFKDVADGEKMKLRVLGRWE